MMVSVDLPDDLLKAIDSQIAVKPKWPFKSVNTVIRTEEQRTQLEEYRKAQAAYEANRSRGAVIRRLLAEHSTLTSQVAHHASCKSCDCICKEGGHE